jgi:hypothetical protein
MPWQVYNSAGQLLQATDLPDNAVTNAKVADDAIDSAELAAGSVDTAHIAGSQITNALMADDAIGVAELSATGTASSSTFLRGDNAWAAAGGAVTRIGGQTTEATTTSTGDTDLLTIGSLTIPGATPIHYIADFRKSSGAATDARGGLKLNSTKIGGRTLWDTDGTNEDQTGVAHGIMGGRVTNYLAGMSGGVQTVYKTDVTRRSSEVAPNSNDSNPSPTADVTSWIVVGSVGSASTTLGIDEVHVYTMGVS